MRPDRREVGRGIGGEQPVDLVVEQVERTLAGAAAAVFVDHQLRDLGYLLAREAGAGGIQRAVEHQQAGVPDVGRQGRRGG